MKSFENLNRECLQDNVMDKQENGLLCNVFTMFVDGNKIDCFS